MTHFTRNPAEAAAVLREGGIAAWPTEGVYGLGCDPANQAALSRLAVLKGRAAAKGFILIADGIARLEPLLAPLAPELRARLLATWPGPVTWVCPAHSGLPPLVTGGRETVAVRVTAHPLAATLCRLSGTALVSTSANRSGEPPLMTAGEVAACFGDEIDIILEGETGGLGGPTEIRDVLTGAVLRTR